MRKKYDETKDYRDSTVAWFVTLERARQDHNFELAAEAKRELERLGVVIKYRRTGGNP